LKTVRLSSMLHRFSESALKFEIHSVLPSSFTML